MRNKSTANLSYHMQFRAMIQWVRCDKGINRWKRTHCRVIPRIIWRTLNEDADLSSDEKDFNKRVTIRKLFSLQLKLVTKCIWNTLRTGKVSFDIFLNQLVTLFLELLDYIIYYFFNLVNLFSLLLFCILHNNVIYGVFFLLDNLRDIKQTSIKCTGMPLLFRAEIFISQIKFPPSQVLSCEDSQLFLKPGFQTLLVCFPVALEEA